MNVRLKWKVCSKCHKRKQNIEKNFAVGRTSRDGLSTCCKPCHNEITRAWIKKNHERYREVKYRRYNEDQARFLLNFVKHRARLTGVKMELAYAWMQEQLVNGTCSVTGVQLDLSVTSKKSGRANPLRPSVDRKNNKLGYTIRNSRVVCWWYNHSKNDWDDGLVLQMAKALVMRHV